SQLFVSARAETPALRFRSFCRVRTHPIGSNQKEFRNVAKDRPDACGERCARRGGACSHLRRRHVVRAWLSLRPAPAVPRLPLLRAVVRLWTALLPPALEVRLEISEALLVGHPRHVMAGS